MIKGTPSDFHLNCLNLTLIFPLFISHLLLSEFAATIFFLWFYLHLFPFHSHSLYSFLCSFSFRLSFFSFNCMVSSVPFLVHCTCGRWRPYSDCYQWVCVFLGAFTSVLLCDISFEQKKFSHFLACHCYALSLSQSLYYLVASVLLSICFSPVSGSLSSGLRTTSGCSSVWSLRQSIKSLLSGVDLKSAGVATVDVLGPKKKSV